MNINRTLNLYTKDSFIRRYIQVSISFFYRIQKFPHMKNNSCKRTAKRLKTLREINNYSRPFVAERCVLFNRIVSAIRTDIYKDDARAHTRSLVCFTIKPEWYKTKATGKDKRSASLKMHEKPFVRNVETLKPFLCIAVMVPGRRIARACCMNGKKKNTYGGGQSCFTMNISF